MEAGESAARLAAAAAGGPSDALRAMVLEEIGAVEADAHALLGAVARRAAAHCGRDSQIEEEALRRAESALAAIAARLPAIHAAAAAFAPAESVRQLLSLLALRRDAALRQAEALVRTRAAIAAAVAAQIRGEEPGPPPPALPPDSVQGIGQIISGDAVRGLLQLLPHASACLAEGLAAAALPPDSPEARAAPARVAHLFAQLRQLGGRLPCAAELLLAAGAPQRLAEAQREHDAAVARLEAAADALRELQRRLRASVRKAVQRLADARCTAT
eukprot:TRINITY_DN32943_c0_g1_i1.p1 TRINITY_DN32943_c0_g1~~TRINITY_DN32943_c0_g1_i1.p1  ORF type:complete len:273 (+),score=82.29 TRINITY_DN32943_c0_g1_i1:62-880(+)